MDQSASEQMVRIFPYLMSSVNTLFELVTKPLGKNETAILWLLARTGRPLAVGNPRKWLERKELKAAFAQMFSISEPEMKNRWYPAFAKLKEKGWVKLEERRTSKIILDSRGISYVGRLEDLLEKLVSESLTDIRNQKSFVRALGTLVRVIEKNSNDVRKRKL